MGDEMHITDPKSGLTPADGWGCFAISPNRSIPATLVAGTADTCTCVRCKCGGLTPPRLVGKVTVQGGDRR
jgi:hypothetical protein